MIPLNASCHCCVAVFILVGMTPPATKVFDIVGFPPFPCAAWHSSPPIILVVVPPRVQASASIMAETGLPLCCPNGDFAVHCTYIRTHKFGTKRHSTRNVDTRYPFRCKPWTKFCPRFWPIRRYDFSHDAIWWSFKFQIKVVIITKMEGERITKGTAPHPTVFEQYIFQSLSAISSWACTSYH